MEQPRIPRPPWREIEEITNKLGLVADKLDALITVTEKKAPITIMPTLTVYSTSGDYGAVTSATKDILLDLSKNWVTDQWVSCRLIIVSGEGSGQTRRIASNTKTQLVPETEFDSPLAAGSVYVIQAGALGFEPQAQGLLLMPEWSAKKGTDKDLYASQILTPGTGVSVTYVIPTGKCLFITQISVSLFAAVVATDGEKNQIVRGYVTVDGDYKVDIGGNGGAGMSMSKPSVATAGQTIVGMVENWSYHVAYGSISINGYEVTV